ncbi:MAG: STAS domain-containing protein [Planctomycetota bacterium]
MAIDWSEDIVVADLNDEPALSDELNTLSERFTQFGAGEAPHIVLSFGNVTYVNSSNIAQMLRLRKQAQESGVQLRLAAVEEQVWQVFAVTGLDKVFTFSPDLLTAIAGLQLNDA